MDRAREEEAVKAEPSQQLALLDIQACDTRLSQLQHRLNTLPESAELTQVRERKEYLRREIVAAETIVSDLERERLKADADVDLVRERSRKDRELLDSGSITDPKQLQSLESESQSLAKRQTDLEDVELEIMERLEGSQAAVVQLTNDRAEVEGEEERLAAHVASVQAEVETERAEVVADRESLVSAVSGELLALYEKIRGNHGGLGAARLHRGRCEGCHLELPPTEVTEIKAAPADEVLRCEECRCILVRTEESGL
jgi:predicted  nucleic acid-binding Zn-ribbon protein